MWNASCLSFVDKYNNKTWFGSISFPGIIYAKDVVIPAKVYKRVLKINGREIVLIVIIWSIWNLKLQTHSPTIIRIIFRRNTAMLRTNTPISRRNRVAPLSLCNLPVCTTNQRAQSRLINKVFCCSREGNRFVAHRKSRFQSISNLKIVS